MKPGDEVVYLPSPWLHGLGQITRAGKHGWLWVEFQDGHVDLFDPHTLELADKWEHEQVDTDTARFEAA